ncbi:MAG TPA: lipid carrier--UDP-N-acetylgalactosaminyltransferase [Planctomycetaceae bacterium]|nr:lipid carrier--UDP-N-acetylgalactosaminyltransferase [Planctomycetaceae bacterium]
MKRLLDIIVSLAVLSVLVGPLLFVMLVLRLTGEGDIFYLQERIGRFGKPIFITKFATMLRNSPSLGTKDITLRDDPRVLPFGKLLRKTKVNELPQFWDVLVGKMSLVGWRPLMPAGFADYSSEVQQRIVLNRPGITGIGSLVFRDEESIVTRARDAGEDPREFYKSVIMQYKGSLEIWYSEHAGLMTDLKILVATAVAVLRPGWYGFVRWFRDFPPPTNEHLRHVIRTGVERH